MRTDKEFYRLFAVAPEQLYALLSLPRRGRLRARSETHKELELATDLIVEPDLIDEALRVIEFMGYADEEFVPRTMIRCGMVWQQNPGRTVCCHLIYTDRQFEVTKVAPDSLFQPQVHYLPDMLEELKRTRPDSLLLNVMRPLVTPSVPELTSSASTDYQKIAEANELSSGQRRAWLDVFMSWIYQRTGGTAMQVLSELPEAPQWLLDLVAKGKEDARREGERTGERVGERIGERMGSLKSEIAQLQVRLRDNDELHAAGELTEATYARRHAALQQELEAREAELRQFKSKKRRRRAAM